MKQFVKKNKFIIIFTILFIALFTIDVGKYMYYSEYNRNLEKNLILSGEISGTIEDIDEKNLSIFVLIDYFYTNEISSVFQIIMPALIVIASCYSFHEKLHSGFIKNQILNMGYKETLKIEFKQAYKAISLILVFFFVDLIMAIIASKFNFTFVPRNDFNCYSSFISNNTVNFILSFLSYVIILLIVHIAYINFGLALCRKTKHFFLTIFIFVIAFMFYAICAEIIVGPILNSLFNTYYFTNGTNLLAFWSYDTDVTLLLQFLYALLILIISCFILHLTYKKKEGVIIDAEK